MSDHDFCRTKMKFTTAIAQVLVPAEIRKEAWTYVYDSNYGGAEFQIPSQEFYYHGGECCAWSVREAGWVAYMEQHYADEFEKLSIAQFEGDDAWRKAVKEVRAARRAAK